MVSRLFRAELRRALQLLWRSPADVLNPAAFFVLGLTLFAIGFGGAPDALGAFAAIVIWILVLLAALLSVESMFRREYEEGVLEQWLALGEPLFVAVLAKLLAYWLVLGGVFLVLAPFAAMALFLPSAAWPALFLTLLIGSPSVLAVAAIGAALTVGVGRGGVLLTLLVLPFLIPVLIFSASAITAAQQGLPHSGALLWLGVILTLTLTTAPFLIVGALRIGVEQ
ncbi:MAG: heme exporter protein CcmB [Pseudomonadota bacterium]